ncbi:MAG: TldD/PmbA family protein [Hyphomonadaceae bacterium]
MPSNVDLREPLAALIAYARQAGADAAEASYSVSESVSAEVRMGALEGVEREEARQASLRVFIGKRQAGASATDVSDGALKALAERVTAMAKAAPEDRYCGLLDARYRATDFPDLDLEDSARPSAEALRDLALTAETAALAAPGVVNSGGASASSSAGAAALMTSDGFYGAAHGTSYSFSVQPIAARDGKMERDYDYGHTRFFADLPEADAIGRNAGARAARRLGPRKIESQKAPVIFENRLAGRVLGPLFGAISGAAVARGVSFLKDKLGAKVFADGFEILEDPLKPRGLASRAFDGEGGAVKRAALIEDGVLTQWLLNAAAARQLGLEPNGHASAGHGGPPGVTTANLRVKPGALDLAGLMGAAGKGLLVTDMFSPSLNGNTGDWSIGVSGFWFERGEIAFPVSEVTVAGNLIDVFARLRPGADLDMRGSLETPSLIVDALAIGGL